MRAVAVPMTDPHMELPLIPDPGFLTQGFLIQGLRRVVAQASLRLTSMSELELFRLPVSLFGRASILALFGGVSRPLVEVRAFFSGLSMLVALLFDLLWSS